MNTVYSFELFELNRAGKFHEKHPEKIYQDKNLIKPYEKQPEYLPDNYLKNRDKIIAKISLQTGIAIESLVPAINSVSDYKVKNSLHIPKMYWKVLRKLTVKRNNIPTWHKC